MILFPEIPTDLPKVSVCDTLPDGDINTGVDAFPFVTVT